MGPAMSHPIILTPENSGLRIQMTFEMGVDGKVELSVIVPNADADMTVTEMQAIACEHVAEALSKRAAGFRRQVPHCPALPEISVEK